MPAVIFCDKKLLLKQSLTVLCSRIVTWRLLHQRVRLSLCPCPYSAHYCHLSPVLITQLSYSDSAHFLQGASTCSCPFCLLQCAVRAATEGRILVLEGLEKAERNVLPVLNNLLENREMQLEDGRFLMSAQRYDKLLEVRTNMLYLQPSLWLQKQTDQSEIWPLTHVFWPFLHLQLGCILTNRITSRRGRHIPVHTWYFNRSLLSTFLISLKVGCIYGLFLITLSNITE